MKEKNNRAFPIPNESAVRECIDHLNGFITGVAKDEDYKSSLRAAKEKLDARLSAKVNLLDPGGVREIAITRVEAEILEREIATQEENSQDLQAAYHVAIGEFANVYPMAVQPLMTEELEKIARGITPYYESFEQAKQVAPATLLARKHVEIARIGGVFLQQDTDTETMIRNAKSCVKRLTDLLQGLSPFKSVYTPGLD